MGRTSGELLLLLLLLALPLLSVMLLSLPAFGLGFEVEKEERRKVPSVGRGMRKGKREGGT